MYQVPFMTSRQCSGPPRGMEIARRRQNQTGKLQPPTTSWGMAHIWLTAGGSRWSTSDLGCQHTANLSPFLVHYWIYTGIFTTASVTNTIDSSYGQNETISCMKMVSTVRYIKHERWNDTIICRVHIVILVEFWHNSNSCNFIVHFV